MMKKICSIMLILMAVVALQSAVGQAAEYSVKNGELTGVTTTSTKFVVPEGVTTVGDSAFEGNKYVETIVMNEGVTAIGNQAFKDCSKLSKIYIPKSMKQIGDNLFKGCADQLVVLLADGVSDTIKKSLYLQEVQYKTYGKDENGNDVYDTSLIRYPSVGDNWSVNGIIYKVVKKDENVRIVEVKSIQKDSKKATVNIPDNVTLAGKAYCVKSIGAKAFFSNKNVKKVIIGKNVSLIKGKAFANCKKLASVKIKSKNCRYQGKNIWKNTSKKLKVYVKKGVLKKQRKLLKKTGLKSKKVLGY